jgi:hypothetical protein
MKTGTSYLQQLMTDNKQVLDEQGLLFPGKQGWSDQVLAVRDILELRLDKSCGSGQAAPGGGCGRDDGVPGTRPASCRWSS